jgi:hypothetical protein
VSNPYLFLVGCPRSGTTLLKRVIEAHPQIAITDHGRRVIRWFESRVGLTPEGLITPALAEQGPIFGFMSAEEFAQVVRHLLAASGSSSGAVSYATLISYLLDQYVATLGKPLIGHPAKDTGHKSPDRVRQIPTLHCLWPQARFVHIIRDGRDVCLSVLNWRKVESLAEGFATWRDDPITTAALWWEWQVRQNREDGCALGTARYYEIRYEALVADPAAECAALCAFLAVPYSDAMLRFHEGHVKTAPDLDAKHAWLPLTPGLRNWRTQMAPADVARFEAAAGDLLTELGYPRGAALLPAELLEHATRLRGRFEGYLHADSEKSDRYATNG